MLWILMTAAAAPLQVARNALQRGLVGDAGPWGATLVRFLFGLPFSLVIFGAVALMTPEAVPNPSARFLMAVAAGALSQVGATAALLVAMRTSGFAVATFMQQSSLPLGALMGFFLFGDRMSLLQWTGLAATTVALLALSWPSRTEATGKAAGSFYGLASGAAFAVALNAYRQAGLALEPAHPIYSATAALCLAQALQSLVMVLLLAVIRPGALRAVGASWRTSLGAGFFGTAASACWFSALALAPAGQVRAIGVIEGPIAAAAGRRLFRERLSVRQWAGGALAALGVVMTALG
jgi:drug/metabolite transporter (DMT)-like permease